jgi:Predicted membrane protein (DUF2061)
VRVALGGAGISEKRGSCNGAGCVAAHGKTEVAERLNQLLRCAFTAWRHRALRLSSYRKFKVVHIIYLPSDVQSRLARPSARAPLCPTSRARALANAPCARASPHARHPGNSVCFTETTMRSLAKAVVWRLTAAVITLISGLVFSGNLKTAASIVTSDFVTKSGFMFLGERVWNKVSAA